MIKGLKATVRGDELRDLCEKRAAHHRGREQVYREKIALLDGVDMPNAQESGGRGLAGMLSSGGRDPVAEFKERQKSHASAAAELSFIAGHIDVNETYQLDRNELAQIGAIPGATVYAF